MMQRKFLITAAATLVLLAAGAAQAQEAYVGLGLPYGGNVGFAYAVNDQFTVRGDLTGGMTYKANGKQGNVDYKGKLAMQYFGLYGDWFPGASSFRLTGGALMHDSKFDLESRGGTNVTIGNKPNIDMSNKYINIRGEYSSVAPYVGLGWGHKKNNDKGWGFYGDLGVMFGKFKLSLKDENVTTSGVGVTKGDIDAEIAKAQKDVDKLNVLPVLNIGVSYSF